MYRPKTQILVAASLLASTSLGAQEINESNLWYGDEPGIEVVFRTGENLAFTDDDPRVDAEMTAFARGMEQAVLKIGERAYLAYGWDITSPMMVVGDDGVIIIDPPMAMEAGRETLEAFRRVTDLPVRAIVYTHNHIDHVSGVKAFASEEDVAAGLHRHGWVDDDDPVIADDHHRACDVPPVGQVGPLADLEDRLLHPARERGHLGVDTGIVVGEREILARAKDHLDPRLVPVPEIALVDLLRPEGRTRQQGGGDQDLRLGTVHVQAPLASARRWARYSR